jgi:Fe-S cluster assembly ATP-binding protein
MLKIQDLSVSIEKKQILKDISLEIEKDKTHVIMGPNGSGKSTLAKILAGDPECIKEKGSILWNDQEITTLAPEERVHLGLFVSFQYPVEIPGVNNFQFLFSLHKAMKKNRQEKPLHEKEFKEWLFRKMKILGMEEDFFQRSLNAGFSGGEKKRNEMLQMMVLNPQIAILDEIDSGLDVDSLKSVSQAINAYKNEGKTLLIITHYQRILNYIPADYVHIMIDGKIVQTGDHKLALKVEEEGYEKFM